MTKKDFFYLKPSFFKSIVFTTLAIGYFLVSVTNAAISDTKPNDIPSEITADWNAQGGTAAQIKESLPEEYAAKCDGSFESACHWRRVYRMSQFPFLKKIMFAKHHNIGSTAVGFWVNVGPSDVTDANFEAKGSLCLLDFENYYSPFQEILKKNDMCVKDPCISLDGKKVIFAMSKGKGQGFLLYEIEIDNPGTIKQLTHNPDGLIVSDYEPCYLPNGNIMFSSTRCYGVIDCGWQPVSNMFLMDSTGNYIRRVGFDQVHTCYPVLRPDGVVLYTRWEYNDRDVSNVMGLFRMNPDGCEQTEVFGNQTTWPQTLIHGRPVPNKSNLFFAVASGHHGEYSGEVCVLDVSKNTNGPEHVTMISPPRKTESRDADTWALGGVYRNSEYPYPLNESWYLVSYREENQLPSFGGISKGKYKIYLKHVDGTSRELLAWADQSLHHPVVVAPWKDIWGKEPIAKAEMANYNDSLGTFTMNDVYYGAGMDGIAKESGVAKTLRVIALNYRVSGACSDGAGQLMGNKPSGVVFAAPTICPVSAAGCSWEAKEVLGEAKIYPDGSAAFRVPARRPVYFQVLDSNGCCIATMRSWATLMPGEKFACYGCHENKSEAPPTPTTYLAGSNGDPQMLDKSLGIENKPFDYVKFVQPILDEHCIQCHSSGHDASKFDLTGDLSYNNGAKKSFAKSYNTLTNGLNASLVPGVGVSASNKAINITTIFSQPPQMPPYSFGSTKSGMIKNVLTGHNNVALTAKQIEILACWIDLEAPHAGTYDSYMSSSDAEKYKKLEQTAKKWYDLEEQNRIALAKLQVTGARTPDNHNSSVKAVASVNSFSIGYLPTERALVLNNFYQGNLILVDLRGRVVSRRNLSDLHTDGIVTVSLPNKVSNGIYVAKFEGVNGIHQAKISITK